MITLNRKDKSMILLIATALIILWIIASVSSSLIKKYTFDSSKISQLEVKDQTRWFNVSRPLNIKDLENRIVIVHFWSHSCISCIQGLEKLNELNEEMGNKITIIGVHSAKFENEKNYSTIKKAISRFKIDYPVISDDDSNLREKFSVKEWPSYLLFDINGNVNDDFVGASSVDNLIKKAKKLISRNKFSLNKEKLPIVPERYGVAVNVLSYPTKISYVPSFSYKSRQTPALLIANSSQNSIIASSLSGEILVKIGSGIKGFEDGTFESAKFNSPQGLLFDGKKIYIADTENHVIRVADLVTQKVETIIGSGLSGEIIDQKTSDAKKIELSSPNDLEFFPDNSTIVISNSGTNQILSYKIKDKTISVLAGNGTMGNDDGKYPNNSLAQTADMSFFAGKLYFVDVISSALRVIDENKEVKTLLGGLGSGHKNGDKKTALLQAPQALFVDDTGIYIADTLNHRIRKYDFVNSQINDLFGSARGSDVGGKVSFDEPQGLVAMLDRLYVSDTNNNRIISLNRGSYSSELIDVVPSLVVQENFLEYLPNLYQEKPATVSQNQEIDVDIKLKSSWKINELASSFINLLEMKSEESAFLIKNYNSETIKSRHFKLPILNQDKNYILQGKIYYCHVSLKLPCYIKSYEQKITAKSDSVNTKIEINLSD